MGNEAVTTVPVAGQWEGRAVQSDQETTVSQETAAERRRDPRHELRLVARLAHITGNVFGQLVNISGGGARFVTTTMEPRVEAGSDVVLILTSPPNAISREVHCTAHITRADEGTDETGPTMSYGIAFDEPLQLDVLVGSD